ncbi:MAG: heme-binding protein, partial [Nitrospira sp.]
MMPPFVQEPISHLVIVATIVLSLAGLPTPQSTSADELPKESVLPLGTATKAIQAALDACKKDGYRVSVSIVDRAGVLRAMGRADGAGSHTVDSSRKKAYTAA